MTLTGGGDTVHLPWHVLPHRAATVQANTDKVKLGKGSGSVTLTNPAGSGQAGTAEVFALTGTSGRIPRSALPQPGDNFAVIDLRAVGVRYLAEGVLQFGVTTFGQRAHPAAPAEFDIVIDTNRDGTPDWVVFNVDQGFLTTGQADGRNVVWVVKIGTTTATPVFFTDADLNSANATLSVPLAAIGLAPGATFDYSVQAIDSYFTGAVTDAIEGMTFTVGTPKFAASADTVEVPAGGSATIGVTAVSGGAAASPSQSGLLLLNRDAKPNEEALLISVS